MAEEYVSSWIPPTFATRCSITRLLVISRRWLTAWANVTTPRRRSSRSFRVYPASRLTSVSDPRFRSSSSILVPSPFDRQLRDPAPNPVTTALARDRIDFPSAIPKRTTRPTLGAITLENPRGITPDFPAVPRREAAARNTDGTEFRLTPRALVKNYYYSRRFASTVITVAIHRDLNLNLSKFQYRSTEEFEIFFRDTSGRSV